MRIYVGNLPFKLEKNELEAMFTEHGTVDEVTIIMRGGRPMGFGFIDMPNTVEAESAIAALNDTEQEGRTINVNEAKSREERDTERAERPKREDNRREDNRRDHNRRDGRGRSSESKPRGNRQNKKEESCDSSGCSLGGREIFSWVLNVALIIYIVVKCGPGA